MILCCVYELSQSCHDEEEEDEEEVKSFEVGDRTGRMLLDAFAHFEFGFLCSFEDREASQTFVHLMCPDLK